MRDPVSREAGGDAVLGPAGEAAARLHQALTRLEASLAKGRGGVEIERDSDRLSDELAAARARENALEVAAAAASQALGRAAAEVRAALATSEKSGEIDAPEKALNEEEAA